jgi:NAD(P)-dependent dehydrogenase (short-subunit alcohol dehydrogenase family)
MPIFVITGANRGLGLEFIRQLSADSSNTILAATRALSRDLGSLESLKSNGATVELRIDLYGKIDILKVDNL